jgi:hypothetical protein
MRRAPTGASEPGSMTRHLIHAKQPPRHSADTGSQAVQTCTEARSRPPRLIAGRDGRARLATRDGEWRRSVAHWVEAWEH